VPESDGFSFFVTKFGTRLRDTYVYRVFWALSRQIGIRGPAANRDPRLHDFRHRFAIETLLRWYRAGGARHPNSPLRICPPRSWQRF
jgi:integrase/recombinase XerD